jgi:hypothetical protein
MVPPVVEELVREAIPRSDTASISTAVPSGRSDTRYHRARWITYPCGQAA